MQDRTSANIVGPDLNEYRGTVSYSLLATQTNYSYLRASGNGSGRFREDRRFNEYVQGLKDVGIKTGGYHYAVPSYDLTTADAQCDAFIGVLRSAYGPNSYGDLFPVIDIEAPTDKSISTDALLNWVDRFRRRFERRTNRVLMLYTGAFFIELYNNFYHSTKGFILSDMPLWIAMYPEIEPNPPYPRDQGGWTRWRVWQFTDSGTIAGVNPPVDLNYGPTNLDYLTQPGNVRNFRAVASGRNIRLTWTANTDVDLAGYNIFMNSSYITTVGKDSTSYTIELGPQVAPVERYEVAIEAIDEDGEFSPILSMTTVTFTRDQIDTRNQIDTKEDDEVEEEFTPMMMELDEEVKEDIKDIVNETQRTSGIGEPLKYVDPVNNLERRFLGSLISNGLESDRNQSIRNLYEDFVESNDEFDDSLYLKRLENEIAYKRYYGEMRNEYKIDFYDTHEDEDDEDDNIYTDYNGQRDKKKCSCKEDKDHDKKCYKNKTKDKDDDSYSDDFSDSKEDYNEDKEFDNIKSKCKKNDKDMNCNICRCKLKIDMDKEEDSDSHEDYIECNYSEHKVDSISDVEKLQAKMMDYQILKKCDQGCIGGKEKLEDCECKKAIYQEKYEGDHCRLEIDMDKEEDSDSHEDYIECNYSEHKVDSISDVEKMQAKMMDYQILKKCDQGCIDGKEKVEDCGCKKVIYQEKYEGDRRRLENRDSKKKSMCYDCTGDKDNWSGSEYSIYDMYLNNCDYGYKGHDDKKKHKKKESCEGKHDKKKKKKHH